ncbi:DUF2244 domain-containing protein [Stappia stellulata]|nr:DUF2244 domain-containing protein [Stappia stellulata]MCA1242759.1 DUF2244 domain-containing protein [Stappia stellulata]
MTSGNPKTDLADAGGCDAQDDDPPFFAAILTPYRSLGANGFRVLMLVVCAICLVAGLVFLALGAWPVFGFLGLDILLIFLAFRWNYKAARAYEQVSVSRTQITILKVSAAGRRSCYRFNPFWARLLVREEDDEGVVRITVKARGQSVDVGGFLNPDDRTSFAGAFRQAVATAKAGGPFPEPLAS